MLFLCGLKRAGLFTRDKCNTIAMLIQQPLVSAIAQRPHGEVVVTVHHNRPLVISIGVDAVACVSALALACIIAHG